MAVSKDGAKRCAGWFETHIRRRKSATECAPHHEGAVSYPSNASADPRAARDVRVSSGAGSGFPVSRNLLVMG